MTNELKMLLHSELWFLLHLFLFVFALNSGGGGSSGGKWYDGNIEEWRGNVSAVPAHFEYIVFVVNGININHDLRLGLIPRTIDYAQNILSHIA